MLIAQISDTHIRPKGVLAMGRVDTAGHLARAVAHINALRPAPDVVLVTGDLVDAGMAEEYAHLRDLLAPLPMPVHLIPGNHDLRAPLRAAFPAHSYLQDGEFLQYVVESGPLRLIALDTLTPGQPHGELCARRLDWLEARLAESDRPAILFMHHPPFDCGMKEFDDCRLNVGAERLAAIVQRHPNVERILCGQCTGRSRCALPAPSPRSPPAPRIRRRSISARCAADVFDGTAGRRPAPMAPGHRPRHAPQLYRRVRRAASVLSG